MYLDLFCGFFFLKIRFSKSLVKFLIYNIFFVIVFVYKLITYVYYLYLFNIFARFVEGN